MSASPAGPPSGPASTTPNGGPTASMRRRKPTGPFAPKPKAKPAVRRPVTQGAPAGATAPTTAVNGASSGPSSATPNATPAAAPAAASAPDPDDDPSLYTEFPLFTTKKALLEGLRHHVMRFNSDREVNPYDSSEAQFQRPVRLQRRFPHDTPKDPVVPVAENGVDDKEREKEAIRKAERLAEREANQAQIAPTDKTAAAKKRQPFKKKTEDVYFPTDTPEAQKRAKLRYEEGRPWHLEDFTGKNTWVGTYEEPLSETHAMFALEGNGRFRMVPLEKWYRFAPTARYQTMNLDEAEMHMGKKVKTSRFMKEADMRAEEMRRKDAARQERLNRGRVGERGEKTRVKGEDDDNERMDVANDVDEIDFEADEEFQDDDGGELFGDDDEAKEAERKIKEERHGANIFAGTGIKEDKDWFEEEEREKREAAEERKKAKKTRKQLLKRERKFEYESESDHPYSEESDSDDSEEERMREEEERKKQEEEEQKKQEEEAALASGASSKASNTPSGRPEKHSDSLRNKASMANLKRSGSPNLSEASGSESTHKRIKKEHGSRHMSPGSLSPNALPRRPHAGSGSDTEGSGNERRAKNSHAAAAAAGRSIPGSPANGGTPAGSRAGTPLATTNNNTLPTPDEVKAAVPPEGITIQALIAVFKRRIPKAGTKEFVQIVKSVARTTNGLLTLK